MCTQKHEPCYNSKNFYFPLWLTRVVLSSSSFQTYLLQIHLIRIVPGFGKLARALLLQRYNHDVISPRKEKKRVKSVFCEVMEYSLI